MIAFSLRGLLCHIYLPKHDGQVSFPFMGFEDPVIGLQSMPKPMPEITHGTRLQSLSVLIETSHTNFHVNSKVMTQRYKQGS